MSDPVRIVAYRPEHRDDFERLNRAWVERHFVVEPSDEAELRDPHGHFIAGGGHILVLVSESDAVIGTCALARHTEDELELAKMTVDEAHRGKGYGDLLMRAAIDYARSVGAASMTLVSNTRLESAIRLYEKHGFRSVPLEAGEVYSRANIRMRLAL